MYSRKFGIIAIFLFLTLISCSKKEQDNTSLEQIYADEGIPVTVEQVALKSFRLDYAFPTVLTGYKESTASAMVADKVDRIHYQVGDYVEKDAVVISFPTDTPGAQYYQTKVAYDLAKTTLDRMTNLYNSGGISLQEFENTKTQYEVAKANWNAVQQTVMVKAPINGIISQINVQETDNVHPGDVLFTVSQTQKLKAKVWADESQVGDITKGDPVSAVWQGIELQGSVVQVDLSLNSANQAFGVVVELNNPNSQVKSGVNATITIHCGGDEKAIVVDRKNIVQQEDKDFVFINDKGIAKKRQVRLGKIQGLQVEVAKGLQVGEQLITGGQMLLTDSVKIKIVEKS